MSSTEANQPFGFGSSEGVGLHPKRDVAALAEYMRQLSVPGSPGDQTADALTEQGAEIERLRAAVADLLCGWRYIRQSHGDLYGVGWDRAQEKAEKALGIAAEAPVPDDCFGPNERAKRETPDDH